MPRSFLGTNERELIERSNAQVFECSVDVFQKISYRDRPDGLLGVSPQVHLELDDLKLPKNPFLLIAQKVEKPGNLGTILRSSDAAGVDAVLVCDRMTDIHNPNVVRSSIGTLFTQPVVETSTEVVLAFLKKWGVQIMAATPHAEKEFTQADLTVPLAIVVGSEQYGLTKQWTDEADILVSIPMNGVADSLNVASATTLLLYETIRQRRNLL